MTKYLRIKKTSTDPKRNSELPFILTMLAQSEAMLHKEGVKSALPHYIAIVKELEDYYGFTFEETKVE